MYTVGNAFTIISAPSLELSCGECQVGQSCSCSLSGTCYSGIWVIKNKVDTPLSSAIVSDIPPNTVTYSPTSTGGLDVLAICFDPLSVKETDVTVGS